MTCRLTEQEVVDFVVQFLINKKNGQWHKETLVPHSLKQRGAEIDIRGGKQNTEHGISFHNDDLKLIKEISNRKPEYSRSFKK